MITFFTIIIVMNLLAWIYAKKELNKITKELDQNKDILKTIYEDRWNFIKRIKLRTEEKNNHERVKQDESRV